MPLSIRDRLIPWYIVGFFVFIALVDGIMVTLAVRTQSGMVSSHPYEQGIAYNQLIQSAKTQDDLGWKGTITYTRLSSQEGAVDFILKDPRGVTIPLDRVSAKITFPVHAGQDFETDLVRQDTHFHAKLVFPQVGLWEVRIYAEASGTPYQQSKRIIVE